MRVRLAKHKAGDGRPKAAPVFCGIEGGSTKTVAVLTDTHGRVLQRVRTAPCNLKLLTDRQILTLWQGIAEHFHRQPPFLGVFMAGCVSPSDEARVRRLTRKVWPEAKFIVGRDTDSGFAAALGDKPGVMVICGTGSNVLARNKERVCKLGGWGHVVGDLGGGYDLARHMAERLFLEYDETGQINAFGRDVLRQLSLNTMEELVTWTLTANKEEIASLAPLVFKRQEPAREVIEEATLRLAQQAVRAARVVGLRSPRVVLTGGLAAGQPYYVARLRRAIVRQLPRAKVSVGREEGALGAALLCRVRFMGVKVATSGYPRLKPPPDRREIYRSSIESRRLAEASTEQPNPRARNLEKASVPKLVDLLLSEESTVIAQILQARAPIETAIGWVVEAFRKGGRLFYVGAGTSGRLGVLDAAECPPTFGTPPEMVQGVIAGGYRALHTAIETAEDDEAYGAESVRNRRVGRKDVVVGITASGSTPFVIGALRAAHRAGARCVLLTCNPDSVWSLPGGRFAAIALATGPEVVAGSTRLKAGTATKLVLNLLSTIAMIRLGKVRDNLMTGLQPSCEKLQDRMARILGRLKSIPYEEAWQALKAAGWNLEKALKSSR